MSLTEQNKYLFAKSFTELAIQNNMIRKCATANDAAKEVVEFFNTIVKNIDKPSAKE